MDSSWVYELQNGDMGKIDIKRINYQTTELRKSALSNDKSRGWDRFKA